MKSLLSVSSCPVLESEAKKHTHSVTNKGIKMKSQLTQNRRGQGLIEFIIIVASVAFISLLSVGIFGHKIADNYAIAAGMLPCAHDEDIAAIDTGSFVGKTEDSTTGVLSANGVVTWGNITGNANLQNNVSKAGSADGDTFVAD